MNAGFRQRTPWRRLRETSALLGRSMLMHSRKKLQKKETSAPVPKKYLEYEVSQRGVVKGKYTDWTRPPWPGTRATICMSYFMPGGPGKEHGTNKPPPSRRVQERSKGDTTCLTTSLNPLWHPSWLSDACTSRKDSESGWLTKDNPETNPITMKPEAESHMAEQSSWVPSPAALRPRTPS